MWLGSPVGIRVSATSSPPSGLQPHWLSLPHIVRVNMPARGVWKLSVCPCLMQPHEAQSCDGDQGGAGGPSANVPSSSLQAVELPDSFSPELRSLLEGLLQRDVNRRLGCLGRG